jgi:hypothetical protein
LPALDHFCPVPGEATVAVMAGQLGMGTGMEPRKELSPLDKNQGTPGLSLY